MYLPTSPHLFGRPLHLSGSRQFFYYLRRESLLLLPLLLGSFLRDYDSGGLGHTLLLVERFQVLRVVYLLFPR